MGTIWQLMGLTVAVIGTLIAVWKFQTEIQEKKRRLGDVFQWANNVIRELQTLVLICEHGTVKFSQDTIADKLEEVTFNTSILLEQGRLLFKNVPIEPPPRTEEHSSRLIAYIRLIIAYIVLHFKNVSETEKPDDAENLLADNSAHSYRPRILDCILAAHLIALAWPEATEEERLRMSVAAQDRAKQFVSLIQPEAGRSKKAMDEAMDREAGKAGDSLSLKNLKANVSVTKMDDWRTKRGHGWRRS